MMSVWAEPFEGVDRRLIHFHTLAGTLTLSLEDASAATLALQAAVERAWDVTPLDTPRSKMDPSVPSTRVAALVKSLGGIEATREHLKGLGLI